MCRSGLDGVDGERHRVGELGQTFTQLFLREAQTQQELFLWLQICFDAQRHDGRGRFQHERQLVFHTSQKHIVMTTGGDSCTKMPCVPSFLARLAGQTTSTFPLRCRPRFPYEEDSTWTAFA